MRSARAIMLCLAGLLFLSAAAFAVPTLQLYSPGATYDPVTETWRISGQPFTLWTVGAKSPETVLYITDVQLIVSTSIHGYDPGGWATIQGLPSEPPDVAAVDVLIGAGGAAPDGAPGTPEDLPPHGVFPAYYWLVSLPDLLVSTAGETVMDYQPGSTGSDTGDIQAYELSFRGFDHLHFDLMGTAVTSNKSSLKFAPFSHDAEHFPVPGALLLGALGLALAGVICRPRDEGPPTA